MIKRVGKPKVVQRQLRIKHTQSVIINETFMTTTGPKPKAQNLWKRGPKTANSCTSQSFSQKNIFCKFLANSNKYNSNYSVIQT